MDTVGIIGVPTDFGADRRGVDMGPSAIRYAGLVDEIERVGVECVDHGDVDVPLAGDPGDSDAKFLEETMEVCGRVEERVARVLSEGSMPVVLGGDHSIAIGTLRGSSRDVDIGVVWFDAHGDFNTRETTPSGNVHGMSLAAALGIGGFGGMEWAHSSVSESNVVLVGTRSLDEGEKENLMDSEVTVFTMSDVDVRGIAGVMDEALDVALEGVDMVHVSVDMDWLDPNEAPGVGTPVAGGATYREAHLALELIARKNVVRSLDVVEVNPIMDERNRTAKLAVELVGSSLGKRIF